MRSVQRVLLAAGLALLPFAAGAQQAVKLGVLNDRSGIYADLSGEGSVVATRLAIEDFGGALLGRPIELIFADHQDKPDVGASIARQWYDTDHVDAIVDVPVSSVALAVQEVARQRNRIVLFSGPGTSDLTGKLCSAMGTQWAFDTIALSKGTAQAVTRSGGTSWFFVTADYAFGTALEADARVAIAQAGGTVAGGVKAPQGTSDFSAYLLQARASGAKVVGLANAGGDTINSVKGASEFGIVAGGQKLAALLMFISDVHALGLPTAQGLMLTESFYWDLNDDTRAWSKRFAERMGGRMPTMVHAAAYSAVTHYLEAVRAVGGTDANAVSAKMRELPVNDRILHGGSVRVDGRVMRPFYLFSVKTPAESHAPYDYYNMVREISAEDASRPLSEGGCPLVK